MQAPTATELQPRRLLPLPLRETDVRFGSLLLASDGRPGGEHKVDRSVIDLSEHTQNVLDQAAYSLNTRPRLSAET